MVIAQLPASPRELRQRVPKQRFKRDDRAASRAAISIVIEVAIAGDRSSLAMRCARALLDFNVLVI